MIDAIFDARRFFCEKVVVRRISRERHLSCDVGGPPHRLLLSDGRDGANAWADEADKSEGWVGWRDDVADRCIGSGGVRGVEVGEGLLVTCAVDDAVGSNGCVF